MSITIERPDAQQLEDKRAALLEAAGLSYDEIRDLAREYMLTSDELSTWDSVRRIDFLLGREDA